MTETKLCTKCGETKPVSDYYRNAKRKGGIQTHCKVCQKAYQDARYAVSANADAKRGALLEKRYGITSEDYDAMLEAQGGVCAICEKTCSTGNRLAVDHCHATGKVRGLLCLNCNQALGKFNDDPNLMRQAIEYLTATQDR